MRHPTLISIHASRMGCDMAVERNSEYVWEFQSTHPVWDATEAMDA